MKKINLVTIRIIYYNKNFHFNRVGGGGDACGNAARVRASVTPDSDGVGD